MNYIVHACSAFSQTDALYIQILSFELLSLKGLCFRLLNKSLEKGFMFLSEITRESCSNFAHLRTSAMAKRFMTIFVDELIK